MKVMGLDNAGKLEYLALDSEIDYTSFEENLPGMVWRKVREDEAPDAAFQQADFLEKPLKDSEGRHNYRISPKGVISERVPNENGTEATGQE